MSSRNTSCERFIALIIGLGLGGCAGLDNSVEFAKSGAPGIYCGPAMVICIPVLGALGVAARPAARSTARPAASPAPSAATSAAAQRCSPSLKAEDFLGHRDVGLERDSVFPSSEEGRDVAYVDATLLVKLEEPTPEGERSYLVEIRADCVTGHLGIFYVSTHGDLEGAGTLRREWSACEVDYFNPSPPLDSIARRLCKGT